MTLIQRLVGAVLAVLFLLAVFVVASLALGVLLAVGLAVWGWLWWKTRSLRKEDRNVVIEGEYRDVTPRSASRARPREPASSIIGPVIQVTVNGKAHRFDAPLEIASLLAKLELAGKKVAVERNGEIVPRSAHARTLLADGDAARDRGRGGRRMNDALIIAGKSYSSRLLVGTGKYRDFAQTRAAVEASRRADRHRRDPPHQYRPEPQRAEPARRAAAVEVTPICRTPPAATPQHDAVRTLRLARELLDGHDLVKLEVLGDPHTLYPNMPETLAAAQTLVKEGFKVMVYCSDDPIQAQMLEAIGCVAVMPLASLIGSGMGILNPWNLQLILEKVKVPVLVDAGVGTASDAAIAMELGCDGVLMNTAIAAARDPVLMAAAMRKAVEAGREAYLAGRMPKKLYSAAPSSPTEGKIAPKAA